MNGRAGRVAPDGTGSPPRGRGRGRVRVAAIVGLLLLAGPAAAAAQQKVLPDSGAFMTPSWAPSPAGAMLRSFLIPGWGQAAAHSYFRGGVYFAAETGSWFMLAKTLGNLASAEARTDRLRAHVLDSLLIATVGDSAKQAQLADPLLRSALVDSTDLVKGSLALVKSRRSQRQDWVSQVIFWTLAGTVDAYVTTMLTDFPGDISVEPRPGGRVAVGYALPVRKPW